MKKPVFWDKNGDWKIVKSLNNSMVLVRNASGAEKICQGKGIGFQRKKGEVLDLAMVERTFVPENDRDRNQFLELFAEIPEEFWEIADTVVEFGRDRYKIQVSDRIILPLCDHMAGSVERYKKGVALSNPMLWDIKRIYPDEFQIGRYALTLLRDRYGVEMQEDEAAFLAYHFINAQLGNKKGLSPVSMTEIISGILRILEESFQITLNEEDWNYQRFLTHLKFFAQRISARSGHSGEADEELYEELAERYKKVNKCVDRIADYILIEHHYDLSVDERLYLLMHIQRVTKRYLKKNP